MDRKRWSQECVRSTTQRRALARARRPSLGRDGPRSGATFDPDLLTARAQMQGEAELPGPGTQLVVVEAFVEAEVLRAAARRPGPPDRHGLAGMASRVGRISLWSFRLAPSIAAPRGTPRPTVSTERFSPRLPRRSVEHTSELESRQ